MTWRMCSTTPMMMNMLKFMQVVRRARLHQMSPHRRVKEHTAARGEGVLPSKRGRAPEDVGQGSRGKRSRTDPVAARRRFDFYFSVLFCLSFLNRLTLFCICFAKHGNEFPV